MRNLVVLGVATLSVANAAKVSTNARSSTAVRGRTCKGRKLKIIGVAPPTPPVVKDLILSMEHAMQLLPLSRV